MADEILYSGIGDQTVAAQLGSFYTLLLADRDASALRHPALIDAGLGMPGSLVMQIPQLGLFGYDQMTDGTEGTAPANTALTDGNDQITLAIIEKIYEHGDLARMGDAFGVFDPETFAIDMTVSVAMTLLNKIAALSTGFSGNVVGTTTVDLVNQDFLDGITKLRIANVTGELCSLLHPQQIGDLGTDSFSLGGAVQMRADMQGIAAYTSGSYQGKLLNVDVFQSSQCPTAGGDVNGMIFGRGAILHGRGQFRAESDANIIDLAVPGSPIVGRLERSRAGRSGLTSWISRAVIGVIEGQDLAGCRVRSDAP